MERWVTAASSLLAFLLYYNTLDAGFVYDDRRAILSNPDVNGHTPMEALFENDFWGTPLTDPGSHGSYRPLCVATYRLNYAFSGFKPWSYHFLNIIFHSSATMLVVIVARRLLPSYCVRVGTAVTGLTFAAHPIHTEAVAGVVGRADLAACNCFLLGFLLYTEHIRLRDSQRRCRHIVRRMLRRPISNCDQSFRLSCHGLMQHIMVNFRRLLKAGRYGPMRVLNACEANETIGLKCEYSGCECDRGEWLRWAALAGCLLSAAAGTLCKEPAIMVVPLCILYDFLKRNRQELYSKQRWRSVCALGMGGLALLYWRLRVAGAPSLFAAADNPASRDPSFFTRTYTFAYLPVFNFFLLLYPFYLSFDWSMDAVPRITSLFDPRNIITIIFYTVIFKVIWRVVRSEFRKSQEKSKDLKYFKKHNCKVKHRWNYNNYKQFNRHECVERKSYYVTYKETISKKLVCSCSGCKHPLIEEHTSVCRASNNNNTMMHYSSCICPMAHSTLKTHTPRHTYRSPQVALLTFAAFMILPFIPASNVLFYVGFVVAERVLYMPSVGFCLLLGLGAGVLTRNWHRNEFKSRMFMCTLLMTLLAMCSYTLRRNLDWRDEESLFRSALHINPPKAYGNLGSVLTAQGRQGEAEVAFERALKHRANMADVHYNLGILQQKQRRYGEAIKSFERAIHFRPSMALAYVNLGASLMADGRLSEAASALRAGSKVEGVKVRDRREHDAARVSALVQLAALHSQRGHWHKALHAYKEALMILPDTDAPVLGWSKHNILSMTGEMYVQLQQWPQAEQSILLALNVAPQHAGTHVTLAQILARNNTRAMEAEMWFKKALTLAPNDPSVRDQFGMFLRSQRRLREAAEQLVSSARLSPTDSVRAAAAARALRDARRCRSAERWYARAVQLNPEEPEYHSNLGAILHLNGKYDAAAASYRRALQLQPNDEITITNLKRVRTLMSTQRRK